MQLNQNSKIPLMPGLLNLDSEIESGFNFPFQYFAEISRPFINILKGIRFAGFFGSTEGSNESAIKEGKRMAYEMKQTLGIKGFVLNLAGSTALATGLPACWDAVRPCLETLELEDAAARILTEASRLAEDLGETNHKSALRLSREEASHLQAGLDFYHFLLPKILVLTSALRLACDQELLKRGVSAGNLPEKKAVGEDGLQNLFATIKEILSLPHADGSVQMPRAWSKYLAAASAQLKPVVQGENYHRASNALHTISRQLAPGFQDRIDSVELGNLEAIAQQARAIETLLPSLIISITLLELFFRPADQFTPARPIAEVISVMAPEPNQAFQPVEGLSFAIPCAA
jgi:hypothetical protein